MKNLETWWNKQSQVLNILIVLLAIVSFLGFLDATYLTAKHYSGGNINCYISIFDGCQKVTSSKYAVILGVPVALLGVIYYVAIFIGVFAYVDTKKDNILTWVARATLIGFLSSLVLVYLQVFIIEALCLYCLFSALLSTLLFVFGLGVLKLRGNIFKL